LKKHFKGENTNIVVSNAFFKGDACNPRRKSKAGKVWNYHLKETLAKQVATKTPGT